MQWRMEGRLGRLHLCLRKSGRFRVRIGIIERRGTGRVAGPEADTAHFLRVSFAGHDVGQVGNAARMNRRWPAGKARHGKIKTAPEKVHRAAFAAEARAKLRQDAIGLKEDAPETI